MASISQTLRRAAQIQEKIEQLRGELAGLLDQARAEITSGTAEDAPVAKKTRGRQSKKGKRATAAKRPTAKALRAGRRGERSPLAGRSRAVSPSGPLAPAVVKVLQSKKQPMNVRDILAGLLAGGYQFNSPEPRKNLAARIYRLNGVKQVDAGLFGVA